MVIINKVMNVKIFCTYKGLPNHKWKDGNIQKIIFQLQVIWKNRMDGKQP